MAVLYRLTIILGGMLFAASLFWYGSHTGFEAKSALLIRTEDGESQARTLIGFSKTEQFIDRTVTSKRFQASVWGNRPRAVQRAMLSALQVTPVQGSNVVVVSATDVSQEGALVLAKESVETLVRMTNQYEEINRESVKVLDDPYVQPVLYGMERYLLEVIATAVGVTLMVELLIQLTGKIFSKWPTSKKTPTPTPEHFIPEKIESFHFPETATPEDLEEILPASEEVVYQPTLPSAQESLQEQEYGVRNSGLQSVSMNMEDLPFQFETPKEETVATPEAVLPESPSEESEPSVLEYKRRLNELLKG